MTRNRLITLAGAAVVLALVVTAGVVLVRAVTGGPDRSRLASAMSRSPDGAQRFSWTDWSAVRETLGVSLGAGSPAAKVQDLLDLGFDADLTSTTALGSSAVVMHARLGFSPATIDWELFSQGTTGASLLLRLSPEVDFDDVRDALARAGYAEPPETDGLWSSDPEADRIATEVTPELAVIAFDDDAGLMVASDTPVGATAALAAIEADASTPLTDETLSAVGDPLSAALYTSAEVCSALAMARADPSEQEVADSLLAQAGKVNPLTGFAIAAEPGGDVRVVMSFENAEQARTNVDTRAVLAAGPAPGQGGSFSERFTLGEVSAVGAVLTMDLEPVEGAYVLSDLSTGPVLFATC